MTTPAYDPGRCINCGGPISDDYPPAAGCCHQSECWGPGTGPGTRRAGLPPDCPHGLYRGDWCDDCGTEVPYPGEVNGPDDDDLAAAGMIGEGGGGSGWCLAAWRESDEAHR